MKPKKQHYAVIMVIPIILAGIFVLSEFDFNNFENLDSDFLVEGINPIQTYKVNDICEYSHLMFSGDVARNFPPMEDWETHYPQEYATLKKYQGETEYEKAYVLSNLSQGLVADEELDAFISVIMKSSSINPILESEIRDMLYAVRDGNTDSWAFQFSERLRVEGKQCNSEPPTHEKLSANLVKSVENLCYGIAPTKNMGACDTMEFVFTGFVSNFPPLDSDNKFDVQHCERVDTILYELDKVMYRDNYQEEGFFDFPDNELREKVTMSFLEKNRMSMSSYDVVYNFVEDLDELLLFWNDAYNKSCQS